MRADRAFVLGLAAAAPSLANAAWGWAKGGDMCAGVDVDCMDMDTCTKTAFGPCATEAEGASQFLSSQFVGLAFVKEDDYLTNAASMRVVDPQEATDAAPNGYRDFQKDVESDNGSKYAYTMTGARFGDMSQVGGYVGIVSYLNQGDVAISTNEVEVRYSNPDATARNPNEETGDLGAPLGPFDVCISQVGSGGACGAARTFAPGEYKFSIFGVTSGPNYPPPRGEADFPEYTHLGVRMKLVANNFDVTGLAINGDKTIENIGNTDVTSLALEIEGGEYMVIAFPQQYNVGNVGEEGPASVATKTIKIKISNASSGDEQALYIDYLFDAADGQGINAADKYFIYDPNVQVQDTADAPAFSSPAAAATGLVAGLLTAAAAMH